MSKLPYFVALGSIAALVSCEPLPPNPPPGYRPGPGNFPPGTPNPDRFAGPEVPPDTPPYGTGAGGEQLPPPREQYPVAQRTANPNQVISPYEPYNVIDVEGFRSGQLARDPSNGKIFRVP